MYFRIKRLFSIYVACHASGSGENPYGFAAQARLMPGFLAAGVRALPHAMRWFRYRDPAARARVKQLLDLSGPAPVALDDAIFRDGGSVGLPKDAAVTVLMPVYNNLSMTLEALRRLVEHTDIPWRLVLVDDASPSADVRPALQAFAKDHADRVHRIELNDNLGFVGAVNEGLKQALTWPDPVVLLNTDAYVPKGWAKRLLRPIWENVEVASVTPMSNDAELASVPYPSKARGIAPDTADQLDAFAATLSGLGGQVTTPTGVGFCMALSPVFLRQIPTLDPVFAPGYGEEVDWCRKATGAGGRHVYVPDLFVAHMGGQSFGSEAKARLIARNSKVISRRYASFDAEVYGFLRRDPLVTTRLALAMRWAVLVAGEAPLPVYFAHSMGGGAEIDLQRRLRAQQHAAIVIRFGGVFRFTVEIWWPDEDAPIAGGTDDWTLVVKLLDPIENRHLVYSNAVGDVDPVEVPSLILSLTRKTDRLDVLMHDYFPISPSQTLLGQGDRYDGLPRSGDARHETMRRDRTKVSLGEWQKAWGAVLERADDVICFSQSSVDLVQAAYPTVSNLHLRPHLLPVDVAKVTRPTGKIVIGVLGNLSPHKGAQVVQDLSRALDTAAGIGLVVLGNLDPAYRLKPPAKMHGTYTVEDLAQLIKDHGITCWLIPSIWPETFSFTAHEAIATGLPVVTFDLGAQAEAVRGSIKAGGAGAILPLGATTDEIVGRIKDLNGVRAV